MPAGNLTIIIPWAQGMGYTQKRHYNEPKAQTNTLTDLVLLGLFNQILDLATVIIELPWIL